MHQTNTTYHRKDMLTVSQITRRIPGLNGGPCSRQHVYNLIDKGALRPAFRFGTRSGICVPAQVVEQFVQKCEMDVGL